MENFFNLYGIFGQNNGQYYANENDNHLPEFLQSVNNGSSSLSQFNLENEEFGPNFNLDFSSLVSSSLLSSTGTATTFAGYYQLKYSNCFMSQSCGWDQISSGATRRNHKICEGGSSKNTARTTKTWMSVWRNWCKARSTNDSIDSYDPVALDGLLTRFYAEIRKQDGSEYEPESLRVMQASLERYLRQRNYPVSIITGREFHKSQETLDCKAKQLRRQGKGKRPNKAQAYTETEEEVFWSHGTLGDHNGTALTNVNFKNLTEIMGMRGRQDHYDAYVEDFSISCQADESKVVEFKENPTKTRQGRLRNPTRHSPQQMWSTDGGERDPVRLFEEWLSHRPEALKNPGPLYLTIGTLSTRTGEGDGNVCRRGGTKTRTPASTWL